jgi:hypothetical protein
MVQVSDNHQRPPFRALTVGKFYSTHEDATLSRKLNYIEVAAMPACRSELINHLKTRALACITSLAYM